MATLKQRLHRKNGTAYDIVHLETESNVVMRPSGNTVETDLTNYLPKVQDSDDVPEGLKSGQIVIGASKGYYCTGDGEVREFGKGGGGVPIYGTDFTYSGDYTLLDDSDGNWRLKFLTSGTFIPLTAMCIDVFLVGGGGGGLKYYSKSGSFSYLGGGGGYTKTAKSIVLTINTEYQIIIGDGGTGANINRNEPVTTYATSGGSSSAFNITVDGGQNASNSAISYGNGGSGGGSTAGTDGSDGVVPSGSYASAGKGQGTTTREFGESTGALYSTGGSGGQNKDRDPNTGDGGGSGSFGGFSGGSGIVIIRNHRE